MVQWFNGSHSRSGVHVDRQLTIILLFLFLPDGEDDDDVLT